MLSVEAIDLYYGASHILRRVSLEAARGSVTCVLGRNGVGKTSLLRALCGLTLLEEGQIRWRGQRVAADRSAFHSELAYQGHEVALKGDLSASENLRYGVGLRREVSASEIAAALQRVALAATDIPVRQLSAGQRRRVALARVLLLDVPLWLMDEPTSNLDADGHALVAALLGEHLAAGGLAVVATHQALGVEASRLQTLELD